MQALDIHLLLNYYPAFGMVIGSLILVAGLWRCQPNMQRLGLKVLLFVVVIAIAVALSGELAGLAAQPMDGPRADALMAHKQSGTVAFVIALATGILALVALLRGRTDTERLRRFSIIVMILAIAASVLLIATIFKGRHVKWVAANQKEIDRPTILENKLWHV